MFATAPETWTELIKTMASVGAVDLLLEATNPPQGTLTNPIDSSCKVGLAVVGLVDLGLHKSKTEKKIGEAKKMLENVEKKMQIKDYDTKTPDNVKAENNSKAAELAKKIADLGTELAGVVAAM